MGFYEDMQAVGIEVLTEFTQSTDATPIKLVKMTPGAGPAENPGVSTPVETQIPGATVSGASLKYVTLGLAMNTDLVVVAQVMPDGLRAAKDDKIRINGKLLTIVKIIPLPASGTPVAFNYICRS